MTKATDSSPPVRPHWKEKFEEEEKERKELEERVAELENAEAQCYSMGSEIKELLEQQDKMETESLQDKLKVACEENAFLRVTISELTATLKHAVKTQD